MSQVDQRLLLAFVNLGGVLAEKFAGQKTPPPDGFLDLAKELPHDALRRFARLGVGSGVNAENGV